MSGILTTPFATTTALLDFNSPVDLTAPLNRGLLNWHLVLPLPQGGVLWRNLVRPADVTLTATEPRSATLGWAPTRRPGGFGELRMNGSAYGRLTSSAVYDFSNTTATVSFWTRCTIGASQFELVTRRAAAVPVGGWYIRVNVAGTLTARLSSATTTAAERISVGTPFLAGGWVHVVVVFTTSTTVAATNDVTIYLNGQLDQGTRTGTLAYVVDPIDVVIGSTVSLQSPFLTGAIDDVRLYTRGLSATEAQALYQASRTGYRRELRWLSSSLFVAPAGIIRSLSAALQGVSATPSLTRIVRRRFTSTLVVSSVTPSLTGAVRRRLISSLVASSVTPSLTGTARRRLISSLVVSSVTPSLTGAVRRRLISSLVASSVTPSLTGAARRRLSSTLFTHSTTPAAAGYVTRRLHSSLLGSTATSALLVQLPGQHVLAAHLEAATQTPSVTVTHRRRLASALLGSSSTPLLSVQGPGQHVLVAHLAASSQTSSVTVTHRRRLHVALLGVSRTSLLPGVTPPEPCPFPPPPSHLVYPDHIEVLSPDGCLLRVITRPRRCGPQRYSRLVRR